MGNMDTGRKGQESINGCKMWVGHALDEALRDEQGHDEERAQERGEEQAHGEQVHGEEQAHGMPGLARDKWEQAHGRQE